MRYILFILLYIQMTFADIVLSQTRKMNTKGLEGTETIVKHNINKVVPKYIVNKDDEKDSVTLAEILFNPEIQLINPDTFKLETSVLSGDSALLQRDFTRIIDVHPQDVMSKNVLRIETKNKKTFIEFYGYIRVNGAEDFNGLQSKDEFNPYYIPVGEENSKVKRFFMSAS